MDNAVPNDLRRRQRGRGRGEGSPEAAADEFDEGARNAGGAAHDSYKIP